MKQNSGFTETTDSDGKDGNQKSVAVGVSDSPDRMNVQYDASSCHPKENNVRLSINGNSLWWLRQSWRICQRERWRHRRQNIGLGIC